MTSEAILNSLLVSDSNSLGLIDIFLAIVLPFLLCFPVTWVYRKTQKSHTYSLAFVQSLFLFSSLSSVMTLIIGSNIARAFGLIGALSIIRFRNALKSPIDAVYIFWALAVGMACGTGYYLAASLIVALVVAFTYFLHVSGYGVQRWFESMIRIHANADDLGAVSEAVEAEFREAGIEYERVNEIVQLEKNIKIYVYRLRSNDRKMFDIHKKVQGKSGVSNVQQATGAASVFAA